MSQYNDEFVNTNAANVKLLAQFATLTGTAEQRLQQLAEEFAQNTDYDAVDLAAAPVYVYSRTGKPVAWYDYELAEGFRF